MVKQVSFENVELGELAIKENTKVVVQLSRRGDDGEYFLSIREWWLPPHSDEYRPTKKGITIANEFIPDFMAALTQMRDYIEEW